MQPLGVNSCLKLSKCCPIPFIVKSARIPKSSHINAAQFGDSVFPPS